MEVRPYGTAGPNEKNRHHPGDGELVHVIENNYYEGMSTPFNVAELKPKRVRVRRRRRVREDPEAENNVFVEHSVKSIGPISGKHETSDEGSSDEDDSLYSYSNEPETRAGPI